MQPGTLLRLGDGAKEVQALLVRRAPGPVDGVARVLVSARGFQNVTALDRARRVAQREDAEAPRLKSGVVRGGAVEVVGVRVRPVPSALHYEAAVVADEVHIDGDAGAHVE